MNSRNIFNFKVFLLCSIFLALTTLITEINCGKKDYLYDIKDSHVINLNPKNFDSQITANRAKNVISLVHFYKLDGNF